MTDEERAEYWRIERRNSELMALERQRRLANRLAFEAGQDWAMRNEWASDPAAEEVSRMLDAICPRCDRALHQCTCAKAAARILCPMCGSYWEDGCQCEVVSHDQRAEDVEGGRAMSHARPDDGL